MVQMQARAGDKPWVAGSSWHGQRAPGAGVGPEGVDLRSPTPATRRCRQHLNQAQGLASFSVVRSAMPRARSAEPVARPRQARAALIRTIGLLLPLSAIVVTGVTARIRSDSANRPVRCGRNSAAGATDSIAVASSWEARGLEDAPTSSDANTDAIGIDAVIGDLAPF